MTRYEWFRRLTFPIMPVHLQTVRKDLKKLISKDQRAKAPLSILDVGGRKSPYTIGLPISVTLLDVPQEGSTKTELNLGFTDSILSTIQKQRSNIDNLIIQDMTQSTLPDASYDAVVCVEVIEHVEEDEMFVRNISKVINNGGWAYFTTPNGDYIKNEGPDKNQDHVRHYSKTELETLLERYFDSVDVYYAVKTGKNRVMGLKGYNKRQPLVALKSLGGNIINRFESRGLRHTSVKTAHLIAIGYK